MADISFAFHIGGQYVNLADIEDKELADDIDDIVGTIVDQIGDLVCPDHNEAPRFLCSGENFDELSVETHGCCNKLIKEVKKRMGL